MTWDWVSFLTVCFASLDREAKVVQHAEIGVQWQLLKLQVQAIPDFTNRGRPEFAYDLRLFWRAVATKCVTPMDLIRNRTRMICSWI